MNRVSKCLFVAAASVAMTGVAFAQDPPADPPPADGTTPPDGTPPVVDANAAVAGKTTSLLVPKGKVLVTGSTALVNLSTDGVGKPIALAPAVYYGVSDKLSVGLTHDGGNTVWTPRPGIRTITIDVLGMSVTAAAGAGICLTGEENGCPKFYDNLGADALFGLADGKFSLAAHGGVDVFSLSEGTLTLRAGVLGRYELGPKMSLVFDPRITVPLTDREFLGEGIDVPAFFWFMASEQLSVFGATGIAGPLDGFGDAFSVPLGAGAMYNVNANMSVGGNFYFLNLLGTDGGADARALGINFVYRT